MRKITIWLGTPVVIVALIVVGVVGYFVCSVYRSQAKLDAVPLAPENYQPAALELVKLCQSDPAYWGEKSNDCLDPFDPVWAPSSVARLHPESIYIGADHAKVFWGGGFYHCGWELTHVGGDLWTLEFFTESRHGQILEKIHVPPTDHFTHDEFVKYVLVEFDRRLAAHIDDGLGTSEAGWYPAAGRCLFLAANHCVDLLPAEVRKSAAHYPHDWRDVLLAFEIGYAPGDPTASDSLKRWADCTTGPAAWMYAAYGFYQAADTADGDAAVKLAIANSATDPEWIDKDVPQYELGMALRLFRSGDTKACVSFCDGILSTTHRDFTTRSSVQGLRDLAVAPATSKPTQPPTYDKYTSLDPFAGFDLALLRAAATTQP